MHLVEPQWNPFVEEQAIARAVRMGQKREVTIVRYVVKGSVEKVRTLVHQYSRMMVRHASVC